MSDINLADLCREASAALNQSNPDALAQGEMIEVDGVAVELHQGEDMPVPVLIAEIGAVEAADEVQVFRNVLRVQLMTAQAPLLRFGYHPVRETLVITQVLKFGTAATGEALAQLIRATCRQAAEWRSSLLAGQVSDPFGLLHKDNAPTEAAGVRA
ncbi:MAG: hypothetical protein KF871_11545 [Hydrogenophaga sp.]|uniref:hypothetical protein n=1 Tax=Hydrogenophaga sp. TaxID=1904254 RepID=UPI001D3A7E9A|nr:hypothetical protein [Hydrogenophaga sp.]MBX3610518.1 hypothetical protein [Hydrogenophaga sp.]